MNDITTAYAETVAAARREEIRRVAATRRPRRHVRRTLVRVHRRAA